MAWKTWNWWSNLSPLHDWTNKETRTMADKFWVEEIVHDIPLVDNSKTSPGAQKNLVDILLKNTSWSKKDKDWKNKLIMNWEAQEAIGDYDKRKSKLNNFIIWVNSDLISNYRINICKFLEDKNMINPDWSYKKDRLEIQVNRANPLETKKYKIQIDKNDNMNLTRKNTLWYSCKIKVSLKWELKIKWLTKRIEIWWALSAINLNKDLVFKKIEDIFNSWI